VFLRANAGFGESISRSSIPGIGADRQTQLSFGASAFWNINRNMRATLSYGYINGTASGPNINTVTRSGFATFVSNSILIGISFFE
jgi:hypothetical protein